MCSSRCADWGHRAIDVRWQTSEVQVAPLTLVLPPLPILALVKQRNQQQRIQESAKC